MLVLTPNMWYLLTEKVAHTLIIGLAIGYKFSTRTLIYLLQPCHMVTAVQVMSWVNKWLAAYNWNCFKYQNPKLNLGENLIFSPRNPGVPSGSPSLEHHLDDLPNPSRSPEWGSSGPSLPCYWRLQPSRRGVVNILIWNWNILMTLMDVLMISCWV